MYHGMRPDLYLFALINFFSTLRLRWQKSSALPYIIFFYLNAYVQYIDLHIMSVSITNLPELELFRQRINENILKVNRSFVIIYEFFL